jgi:hypothetical protein
MRAPYASISIAATTTRRRFVVTVLAPWSPLDAGEVRCTLTGSNTVGEFAADSRR